MKKLIVIFMAMVMCLAAGGCGNGGNSDSAETTKPNDGRIELTLDNYEQYLELYITTQQSGEDKEYKKKGIKVYHDLNCELNVRGVTDNFNYCDINITADIDLTYKEYSLALGSTPGHLIYRDLGDGIQSEKVTISNVNIAGDGSGTATFSQENLFDSFNDGYSVKFEVKSVSGYVVPAK